MKEELQKKELPIQFNYIDKAKKIMLEWTKEININLQNIEYVVPFILSDKSLSVWFFFDNDQTKSNYEKNGTNDLVKTKYLEILKTLNYPSDYLNEVTFEIDSDENVTKNYEGSYFYRLR
jgi:hypothetical protein